ALLLFASLFFIIIPPPPRSTLFPYTTLFRSRVDAILSRRERRVRNRSDPSCPGLAFTNTLLCGSICHSSFTHRFPNSSKQRRVRSEEHTSELQSRFDLVCRLLLEKKNRNNN